MRVHETRPRYTVDNSRVHSEAGDSGSVDEDTERSGFVPRPFACLGLGNLQQLLLMLTGKCNDPAKKLAAGAANLAANLVEPGRLVKLNSSHDVGGLSPYRVQWFLSHADTFAHFEGNVGDTPRDPPRRAVRRAAARRITKFGHCQAGRSGFHKPERPRLN